MGLHGCAVGGGVDRLEVGLVIDERAHHHCCREPDGGISPLRPRLAGGPPIAGSGRSDRRAGIRRVRRALCGAGRGRLGQPAAHRSQARTATATRPETRSAAVDHQNHRRAIHYLADHAAQARRREIRCGAAVPPGCVDRRVEARSRRRPALPESATAARGFRGVHAAGRGRVGRRRRPPTHTGSTPRW